ncbi:UDP-Gal:alpha-D-GlcNAc-diphosphoundecaprenol beta-1,3-galactosyltransferase [bioreactor metagenome]|uniref:UDP-Gal:alpha-D-GlcNAc-diphosphoundecaprenol beta-1,3-galactosyltransferase n=1 Tax=bioreactor metagenome TaxID=1076179 RepID=A0A645I3X8_9ZZZZ
MLQNGSVGFNIQEPLLRMRIGKNTFLRRGGWKYAKSLVRFYTYMYKIQFIGFPLYVTISLVRVAVALAPGKIREKFYLKLLRKSTNTY